MANSIKASSSHDENRAKNVVNGQAFAKAFSNKFNEKRKLYLLECTGDAKDAGKTPKTIDIIGSGIKAGSKILGPWQGLSTPISDFVINAGKKWHKSKAQTITAVLSDVQSEINGNKYDIDGIAAWAGCYLFQSYELQFTEAIAYNSMDVAVTLLAKDAVDRLFNYVYDNAEKLRTVSKNDFTIQFIIDWVTMGNSKGHFSWRSNLPIQLLQGNNIRYKKRECNTADIFKSVGIADHCADIDNNNDVILRKRKRKDCSARFGFRLKLKTEIEIIEKYTKLDKYAGCTCYDEYKTQTRYISSEQIVQEIFDALPINTTKGYIWFNIKIPAESFTGRDEQLKAISDILEHSGSVCITGLGGTGKSELVKKYISSKYQRGRHNVVWINAENIQATTDSFKKLHTDDMNLSPKNDKDVDKSCKTILHDVYDYFAGKPVLFVFDNICDKDIVRQFSATKPNTALKIIYTTFFKSVLSSEKTINLKGLEKEAVIKLLKDSFPDASTDEIEKLGKKMNNSPLGLNFAASAIKKSQYEITYFLRILEDSKMWKTKLLKQNDEENRPILSSIEIILNKLKSMECDDSKFAIEILDFTAYISADNIPLDILVTMAGQRVEKTLTADQKVVEANAMVRRSLELLHEYSLLEHQDEKEINVYRLVQYAIQLLVKESTDSESKFENILNRILEIFEARGQDRDIHVVEAWKHAFDIEIDTVWTKIIDRFIIQNQNQDYPYFHGMCAIKDSEIIDRVLSTIKTHYSTSSFDVNAKGVYGDSSAKGMVAKKVKSFTPLHVAVYNDQLAIVEKLLAITEVDINAKTAEGMTALHFTAQYGFVDILEELIKNKANVNEKTTTNETALCIAIIYDQLAIVERLLDITEVDINTKPADGLTALHLAVCNKNVDVLKKLLKTDRIEVNAKGANDMTALHFAAQYGCVDILEELIKNNANVNEKTTSSETALHIAVCNDQFAIVKKLIMINEVDINAKKSYGLTALHLAVRNNRVAVFKELLKMDRIEINKKRADGMTALHVAAQYGCVDILDDLIKKNANVSEKTTTDETALHIAVYHNQLDIVKKLLKIKEVDIDAKTTHGWTALYLAVCHNRVAVLEELLKTGRADVNALTDGWTLFRYIPQLEFSNIVQVMIQYGGDVNIANEEGWTALHKAVKENLVWMVEALLKIPDINIDAKTNNGQTALQLATDNNLNDIIALINKKKCAQ